LLEDLDAAGSVLGEVEGYHDVIGNGPAAGSSRGRSSKPAQANQSHWRDRDRAGARIRPCRFTEKQDSSTGYCL